MRMETMWVKGKHVVLVVLPVTTLFPQLIPEDERGDDFLVTLRPNSVLDTKTVSG